MLPADLFEDVIPADIFDILIDDRSGTLFFCQLPLQPLHNILIAVPQISLEETNKRIHKTKCVIHGACLKHPAKQTF